MEIANLIEIKDYKTIKNEILTQVQETFNGDLTFIESDSFSLLIEAFIYRELMLRVKINQVIKDSFTLINTDDTNNTAGSEMAYRRAIREVDENILDIHISSPAPGRVKVVYHHQNDITELIQNHLDKDEVRPLTDIVTVQKATIVTVDVPLSITVFDGVDTALLMEDIQSSFGAINFKIGENLTTSKVIATAFKVGVYKVETPFNTTDIQDDEIIAVNLSFSFEVLS